MPNSETKLPQNRIHLFDPVSLINDDNDDDNNNNNPEVDLLPLGYGDQIPMYTALSFTNRTHDRSIDNTYKDEVSSPPLWKPNSPPTSPKHPNHLLHQHQTMSPNSRTQAIARGRKELMEMVRDLPESYYELSLRDIVDKQKPDMEIDPPEEKKPVKELITRSQEKNKKSSKKSEEKAKMVRSKSIDNGKFLLKTSVFPNLLGSKKSKKSSLGGGSGSFKIAPVPKPQPTPTRSSKGQGREWWRRRSCMSSESDESNGLSSSSTSSGSSRSSSRSNSNSSGGRSRSRFLPSCCFFNGRSLKRIKDKK